MRGKWTGDDTFSTEAMGFTYASLAQVGGGRRRRDLPVLAQFNDVPKVNVDGSKALYVYVSDAGDGDDGGGLLGFLPFVGSPKKGQPSWQPPPDLESATPAERTHVAVVWTWGRVSKHAPHAEARIRGRGRALSAWPTGHPTA